jgi:transcriptional regulator with XRE-family HTH domain
MPGGTPSSQRRKLKAELQKARSAAGLTQREVAQRLDWSESKLIRVENGEVGLSVTDLRALLRLYEVTDRHVIADLSEAARGSRGSSWWSKFRDVVPPKFALYLGQEASATSIRVFHPFLVPGLLHTEQYAFETLRVVYGDSRARRIVEMRQQRQQSLLGHPDSPELTFVFGEEALHRLIGSTEVMIGQLEHLVRAARQTGTSVEVMPFTAGAHPGLLGQFILLGFEDPAQDLLFVEGISGTLVSRSDREKVDQFSTYFDVVRKQAFRGDRAVSLFEQLIEKFRSAAVNGSGKATQASGEYLSATTSNASRQDDAREDRWRPLGDDVRNQLQSSSFSPGPSATGAARPASSRSPAACLASLSSALL